MKVTKEEISGLYRIFGYINFGFSILFIVFSGQEFDEKILIAIFINLFYHLCYIALVLFSKNSFLKKFLKERPIRIIFKVFLGIVIISSFLYPLEKLGLAIINNDYSELFMVFILFGLFLGAISFWLSLNEE